MAASQAFDTQASPNVSFVDALKSTAMDQVQTVQQSETMSMNAMHGRASLQEVVQATVKAELAVETALAIRNKMIESYQEIMRMPI
jgi:flagellar hook-basal body complex protein FliE